MKTTLHTYCYHLDNPTDAAAYKALCDAMKARGTECFETWGGKGHYLGAELNGREVELEIAHVFENQWNTAPIDGVSIKGLRVFDWAQDYLPNKQVKRGHWLELTPEMIEIRQRVTACGYCGAHYGPPTHPEPHADGFCHKCIGSEYLKPGELHLFRLLTVAAGRTKRAPLTDAESAALLPEYRTAQGLGLEARTAAVLKGHRAKVARIVSDARAKAEREIANAQTKEAALNWLLDHDWRDIDNVIFYDHTQRFSFGWSKQLSAEQISTLETLLTEFPFDYDIKRKCKY